MEVIIRNKFSEPQKAILRSTAALNLFLAGTGSGKTHLGGAKARELIANFPKVRGFIAANTYDQLNTSTLFRFREFWAHNGMSEWNKENPSGVYVSGKEPPPHWSLCKRNFDRFNNIISFNNGGLIFTGSLDNYFSHSGKEFGWAMLDETKDTDEEAVKEVVITRLRQPGMYCVDGKITGSGSIEQQYNPLYCFTSPARVEWLNQMFELENFIEEIGQKIYSRETFFHKQFKNKCVVISSTYHNVHNVGENYINNIFATNSEERAKALVFGNPFATTGGEFYSSFDRMRHVGRAGYDPTLAIHISFDQNSVPYNSAGIAQIVPNNSGWEWRFIDEIALPNPRNSTEEVCDEFMMRYPNHKAGLFFYGDASGHNRSTLNKDFSHHYEIIAFKLRRYLNNISDRTLISNPSVVTRRDFMNKIFEDKLPIKITIDESCHYLIADLMYCKQALDGGKDKHIVTDKETGDKYQKYGHFGDLTEYMAVELFKNYYNG